jgi:hypothetical protein
MLQGVGHQLLLGALSVLAGPPHGLDASYSDSIQLSMGARKLGLNVGEGRALAVVTEGVEREPRPAPEALCRFDYPTNLARRVDGAPRSVTITFGVCARSPPCSTSALYVLVVQQSTDEGCPDAASGIRLPRGPVAVDGASAGTPCLTVRRARHLYPARDCD